jgi:adenylate cyclase, class 2
MPLNLELKIKVDSHSGFNTILKNSDAEDHGVLKQKDIYFKVKKGLLKLRVEGETFTLVKYFRDEKRKRWSDYELLKLEGKNPEKYLKDILEIETIVEKKRIFWLFDNTRIHLDEVKGLGKFLELETLFTSTRKDAEKRFKKTVELLNLDLSKQIRASYKNLLMKK